jgi:hypothetical protein
VAPAFPSGYLLRAGVTENAPQSPRNARQERGLIPEMTMTVRLNLEKRRFEVIDDPTNVIPSETIDRIKAIIAENPGIIQQRLLEKADLPETRGRKILQKWDGEHWFSSRGDGKTLCYFLKKRHSG